MKTDFEYQQMPFPVCISNLPLKVIEAKAIKGKEYTCRGGNCQNCICLPCQCRFTLKGDSLLTGLQSVF